MVVLRLIYNCKIPVLSKMLAFGNNISIKNNFLKPPVGLLFYFFVNHNFYDSSCLYEVPFQLEYINNLIVMQFKTVPFVGGETARC